jgi:hypothetical protein
MKQKFKETQKNLPKTIKTKTKRTERFDFNSGNILIEE